MRVAVGGLCRELLHCAGIELAAHVVELGGVNVQSADLAPMEIAARTAESSVYCVDPETTVRMEQAIRECTPGRDTLGGVYEVVAEGVPPGLCSHASYDRRLDGRLAGALMSIPAMKGVEIGIGFEAARRRGSAVHDEILWEPDRG